MTTLAEAQALLTEATAARHAIMTGRQKVRVTTPNGLTVMYEPGNPNAINAYIAELKNLINELDATDDYYTVRKPIVVLL